MIPVWRFAHQKVGVFGLGKAGGASVVSLLNGGAVVYTWDDKAVESFQLANRDTAPPAPMPINSTHYRNWPWDELKALVLSPGVPLTHPVPHEVVTLAQQHGCPIIGDLELLYLACPEATFVGITGTNGKSTTTTLIAHILDMAELRVEVGGNLGRPALDLAPLGKGGIYVIEASSYQLDLLRTMRFNVAALLNITPDHLDRHGSMEGYIAAKMHIFDRQKLDDTAVIAVDDEYTKNIYNTLLRTYPQRLVAVSAQEALAQGVYVENELLRDGTGTHDLRGIPTLTGRHNWQNAAVAFAVARACGVSPAMVCEAMKTFPGLRHRLQLAAKIRGVRFINDSKATNADAASHALAPYESIYWIAGGKPKAGGIESLAPYFPKVAHAFLIGEAEAEFAKTLEGKVSYTRCGTLEVAVKKAAEMAFAEAKNGAVVLLSPACASWDQWTSFEARGDAFCAMAETLAHEAEGGERHAS